MDHTTLKLHLYSDVLSSVQLSVSWFEIWNLFAEILKLRVFLSKYSDINWWKTSEQFYANTPTAIGGALLFCRNTVEKSMANTNTQMIWLKLVVPSSPPAASISGFAKMRQGAKNQFGALPQMHNYAQRPIWDAAIWPMGAFGKTPSTLSSNAALLPRFLLK